jgi:mRNA-degrading endonuclease HigB of HigAB toxin-antitoxin module
VGYVGWVTPQAVKADYRNASILEDNRVCFNIAGNKYRLVVKISLVGWARPTLFVSTVKSWAMPTLQLAFRGTIIVNEVGGIR